MATLHFFKFRNTIAYSSIQYTKEIPYLHDVNIRNGKQKATALINPITWQHRLVSNQLLLRSY